MRKRGERLVLRGAGKAELSCDRIAALVVNATVDVAAARGLRGRPGHYDEAICKHRDVGIALDRNAGRIDVDGTARRTVEAVRLNDLETDTRRAGFVGIMKVLIGDRESAVRQAYYLGLHLVRVG